MQYKVMRDDKNHLVVQGIVLSKELEEIKKHLNYDYSKLPVNKWKTINIKRGN